MWYVGVLAIKQETVIVIERKLKLGKMRIEKNYLSDASAQVAKLICDNSGTKTIVWVSDLHGDSRFSNLKFLERVLEKYPNSLIVVGGDHLDVMQNFGDRRASKTALKEQFKTDSYINEVIDHNVKMWGKYAHRILAFFVGNHEATQNKFHGIDITREIVKELNLRYQSNIVMGDLAGWLKLQFKYSGRNFTKNVYYAHKPISGGTRSKGMLSVDIVKGRYPDADIYISEHIHDTWAKPERVEVLTGRGKVEYKNKWVLQMPTLKDEFAGKKRGYTHSAKYGATPVGVVLLQFDIDKRGVNVSPKYELVK